MKFVSAWDSAVAALDEIDETLRKVKLPAPTNPGRGEMAAAFEREPTCGPEYVEPVVLLREQRVTRHFQEPDAKKRGSYIRRAAYNLGAAAHKERGADHWVITLKHHSVFGPLVADGTEREVVTELARRNVL